MPERPAQRLVHQRDRDPAEAEPEVPRRGRPPDPDRGLGDPLVRRVELEPLPLVGGEQLEVAVVGLRQPLDPHQLAEPGGEAGQRHQLDRVEVAPAVAADPAHRADQRGGQDVLELVVGDVVVAVDPVQPPDRGAGPLGVDALDDRLLLEEQGVVVPLDAVVLELAGPVEQPRDRRDAVVAQERDRRALVEVPREVVAPGEGDDPVAVGVVVGVEGPDLVEVVEAAAGPGSFMTPSP